MSTNIEINEQFARALDLLENTKRHLFITGRAGTGKSTLLKHWRETTKKSIAVLAPTGVAAVNIEGETIHRFFRFKPGVTLREAEDLGRRARSTEVYHEFDAIVIDEISMVRADLLDCIDVFLRRAMKNKEPFGGKQMVMIGDLYQLPPVVKSEEKDALKERYATPYFFSATVSDELKNADALDLIELEKIYRQSDNRFIGLLNAVRNRSVTEEHLGELNERLDTDFQDKQNQYIHLTATNAQADLLNAENLARLRTKEKIYQGTIIGQFTERDLPTDVELRLKPGARVMLVKNDPMGRWVNGTLGTVRELGGRVAMVKLDSGTTVAVEPFTWSIFRSIYNTKSRHLERETMGSFTQMPLRLAWATTIHKSQGKTFDRVVIDLGRGAFAAGQVYVALSRCRTLEGIVMKQALVRRHLILDYEVMKFLTSLQYDRAGKTLSDSQKRIIITEAIAKRQKLNIVYLKAKDEKSRREILPQRLAEMDYEGHPFTGLEAHCFTRGATRVFNIARILEIEMI